MQLNASHYSLKFNNATTAMIMDTKQYTANDTLSVGNAVRNTIHTNVNGKAHCAQYEGEHEAWHPRCPARNTAKERLESAMEKATVLFE